MHFLESSFQLYLIQNLALGPKHFFKYGIVKWHPSWQVYHLLPLKYVQAFYLCQIYILISKWLFYLNNTSILIGTASKMPSVACGHLWSVEKGQAFLRADLHFQNLSIIFLNKQEKIRSYFPIASNVGSKFYYQD